jgi:cobalt-zinc-cadmium efflux system outer membrane protein
MHISERRASRRVSIGVDPRGRARTIAAVLPLFLAAQGAMAQSTAAAPPAAGASTRLGALYSDVRRDNPRVVAAEALVRAARARVPGMRRPPDPQLQLGFMNYTLPGLDPMEAIGMTQLQLMQMVPLGGKLGLAGRVASAQASATGERAQDVVWELRSKAAMAFYDLYAVDRKLEVMRESFRLLQDVTRTVEAMYRVGDAPQADVLRAQVELARMAEDSLRMQAMRQSMAARLNALRDRPAEAVASPVLPRFPDTLPSRASLDSMSAGGRPMIRAGLEEVRAADASATLARRELVPDLQLGVQYGQRGTTMLGVDPVMGPTSERITERMGSLMIGATLPIFARSRQIQMRLEASAMKAMAEADVASMRAETRGRIGEVYADLERSRNLTRLYRATVLPQAEAAVSSATSAYRVGKVDLMTLLDDRMAVNRYRQELYTLQADEGKAWAELEMLVGRELLDSDSVAPVAPVAPAAPAGGVDQGTGGPR